MELKIIYALLVIVFVGVESKTQLFITDGPVRTFGKRIYKEELLTDKFNDPKELVYDSSSRNLFFMYMDDNIQNSGRAYINVLTKQAMKIQGIEKNKAIAVDTDTSEVYFGSEDGLYKFDPIDNIATNIGLYNINIMKLVIRNNQIYLIDANTHMIYKVSNEMQRVVRVSNANTVMEFDVDNDNNIHFVSMCGVYCLADGHEVVKNKDLRLVYHFIVDGDKTLGITGEGIYELHCRNGTATRTANIDFFARSITLGDYGDIFYSINNNIYMLRPITSYVVYILHKRPRNNAV